MAINNGVITAPVDASDPYYVMGVGQYNGWWDIGYICTHPNINPFSRVKPLKVDQPEELPSFIFMGSAGFKRENITEEGVGLKLYTPEALTANDWKRLTDFNGYNHNAKRFTFTFDEIIFPNAPSGVDIYIPWDSSVAKFSFSLELPEIFIHNLSGQNGIIEVGYIRNLEFKAVGKLDLSDVGQQDYIDKYANKTVNIACEQTDFLPFEEVQVSQSYYCLVDRGVVLSVPYIKRSLNLYKQGDPFKWIDAIVQLDNTNIPGGVASEYIKYIGMQYQRRSSIYNDRNKLKITKLWFLLTGNLLGIDYKNSNDQWVNIILMERVQIPNGVIVSNGASWEEAPYNTTHNFGKGDVNTFNGTLLLPVDTFSVTEFRIYNAGVIT